MEGVAGTNALIEDTSDVEHRDIAPVGLSPPASGSQRKLVEAILAGCVAQARRSTIGPSGVSIAATSPDTSWLWSPRWIARARGRGADRIANLAFQISGGKIGDFENSVE